MKRSLSAGLLPIILLIGCMATVPAQADTVSQPLPSASISIRTFPATNTVRAFRLSESTTTSNDDGTWGGTESLNVPRTESTQEKKDRIAREQAEQAAQQAEQARRQTEQQARTQAQTASRSSSRESISKPSDAKVTGRQIADYSTRFVNYPYAYGGNTPSGWDCSGFVQYVYSQFGISIPHASTAQMTIGSPIGSLAEALPGDLIVNGSHSGIYLGNGLVMNALNPVDRTQITGLGVYYGGYQIRRII